jgi:hypothetical protein
MLACCKKRRSLPWVTSTTMRQRTSFPVCISLGCVATQNPFLLHLSTSRARCNAAIPGRDTASNPICILFYLNQIKFDLSLTNSTLPDALDSTEFHGRTDTPCHPERATVKTVWGNDQSFALPVISRIQCCTATFWFYIWAAMVACSNTGRVSSI